MRAELSRALSVKFGVPERIVKELELFLAREAVTVPAAKPAGKGIRDEADRLILGSAAAGRADLFIAGDRELQQAGRIASMSIVSPRQFWQLLRK